MKRLLYIFFIALTISTTLNAQNNVDINELKKRALQGDATAQRELGVRYYYGKGVTKNYPESVRWWRKAAEQEDAAAQHNLGISYFCGYGVTQNYSDAVRWWRKAADQGHADAQFELAGCYRRGDGVTRDLNTAILLYHKAAEQGHAKSQFELYRYYSINGIHSESIRWLRKAAESGLSWAQTELAYCYRDGNRVTKNDSEANRWFLMAAKQGYRFAQDELGRRYLYGDGITQNTSEALRWLCKGAEQQGSTILINWKELKGDVRSELAILLRKKAESGNAVAQSTLYLYQNEFKIDHSEAIRWLRKAAELGLSWAQVGLGNHYYKTGDKHKAVHWYIKAAEQGDYEAQFNLGACYEHGIGVTQDYSEAIRWYSKAAKRDHRADDRLEELLSKMNLK